MDAEVLAQFGVEGSGEEVALADHGRVGATGGDDFDGRANVGDSRGADVDHFERASGEGGCGGQDRGVVLATVEVALDGDVHGGEAALRWVGDGGGEEDGTGAGAEGGFVADEGAEGVEEVGALEVLEEGGGLAARDDQAVELRKLFGLAHEDDRCAELAEHGGVGFKGALEGQDADGWGLFRWF